MLLQLVLERNVSCGRVRVIFSRLLKLPCHFSIHKTFHRSFFLNTIECFTSKLFNWQRNLTRYQLSVFWTDGHCRSKTCLKESLQTLIGLDRSYSENVRRDDFSYLLSPRLDDELFLSLSVFRRLDSFPLPINIVFKLLLSFVKCGFNQRNNFWLRFIFWQILFLDWSWFLNSFYKRGISDLSYNVWSLLSQLPRLQIIRLDRRSSHWLTTWNAHASVLIQVACKYVWLPLGNLQFVRHAAVSGSTSRFKFSVDPWGLAKTVLNNLSVHTQLSHVFYSKFPEELTNYLFLPLFLANLSNDLIKGQMGSKQRLHIGI